ncbi:MAG: DUF2437 domain-containing protein, partial [Planctomycetes bacterium]|nr:DUF2437 domain-containing protein [Planctomycetota bacterium]
MRIASFLSSDGRPYTGRLVDQRTAQPLAGGLFGPLSFADETVSIDRMLAPVEP